MFANKKIAVGAANTAFFIMTPSAESTAYYGSLMGFRPGDAPGGQSWLAQGFGAPPGVDSVVAMLDWGSGYIGPAFRPGETAIAIFRSELATDTLGVLSPVVSMAVIAADGKNSNGNSGGVEWSSALYSNGMEEYGRQGDLEETFDLDMRDPSIDGLRAFGAGYMGLGHYGLPWGQWDQFRGAIHHFEMHNTTLTDAQTNDVISGLLPLMNASAPPRAVCHECPPGKHDHDSNAATPCANCAIGSYSDIFGATSCDGTCALGSSVLVSGSASEDECTLCSAGTFGSIIDNVSLCTPCAVGRSSSVIGSDSAASCSPCPSGESSVLGSTSCLPSGCTDAWASNYDPTAVVQEGACEYSCTQMITRSGGASGTCVIFEADSWVRYATNGTNDTEIPGGAIDDIPTSEVWIVQGRMKPGTTATQPEYERASSYMSLPPC